jgi:two-component system cell cycle response regulator CtrA
MLSTYQMEDRFPSRNTAVETMGGAGPVVSLSRARVQTMRALVIESALTGSDTIVEALKSAGFGVDETSSVEEALEICRYYPLDVLVVDLRPDILGYQAICRFRAARVGTPLLAILASTDGEARVRALSMGADDVVSGGYLAHELIARIKALARRGKGLARPRLKVGNVSLDLLAREASVDGQTIGLTNKEYAILEVLATRMGAAVRKEAFLRQLYDGLDEPSTKAIDVTVCRLRHKLRAAGADNVIRTIHGHGYAARAVARIAADDGPRAPSARREAA